tara:strand:- start:8362 stop:9480 length:1119 start_codon:yes stop_codon:yes gene_type:complete
MTSKEAFLALNLLPGIGPIRVRQLLKVFKEPAEILETSEKNLQQVAGIGAEIARSIRSWETLVDLAEEKRRIAEHEISLITLEDDEYPTALREIHDPPFLLYLRGNLEPNDAAAIGIVGSRRMTHYGREQARKLSFQLARAGFTIISGLARGIDTAAHEAALAAEGRTIAVLGSGIGNIYPPENDVLADRIAENGAVISEFPVLYVPDKQSFPLRNRIVSGMSEGLLVVEAPARSGSLITASQAMEQGRTVFAVPGPIDRPTSEGCNRLIRDGATLVSSGQDVINDLSTGLNSLNLEFASPKHPRANHSSILDSLDDQQSKILDELEKGEQTIDTLSEAIHAPASTVSASLLQLEMKHLIKQLPGKYFTKLI